MPPITVYTASPINASKASSGTPVVDENKSQGDAPNTTTGSSSATYPAATPGARPPAPTPAFVAPPPQPANSYYAPTPTQPAAYNASPPMPQPGAVPVPLGENNTSRLPPPPKTGESLGPQHLQSATQTVAPLQMPVQMSYAPPNPSLPLQTTSSTAQAAASFDHPPGYVQNVHASEFSSHQRAAHNATVSQHQSNFLSGTGSGAENEEGIWDTAKKWATAAGEGLAAAEGEVWKRINKE